MASSVNDDFVILECCDPSASIVPVSGGDGEMSMLTADISDCDLPAIVVHRIARVKADRNRLVEESSYFGALLGGCFSESRLHSVTVHWNLEAFLNVLRFIHGCPLEITSSNFLSFFQAALYFGVELLLLECQSWLFDDSNHIEMDDLVPIHTFSSHHGIDSICERCVSYMARNFMSFAACGTFVDIPCSLLFSCVEHPHLTINSERHLSDALLAWVSANAQRTKPSQNEDDPSTVLKQIHVSLLPLWFSMGKHKCDYFSALAKESINAVISLLNNPTMGFTTMTGDADLNNLRIRLTEYTKKLDLSGCPQMNSTILLHSLLPSSYSSDHVLEESVRQAFMGQENHASDYFWKSPQFELPTTVFQSVLEVDISKCPSLHLGAAIKCFRKSFPVLQNLRAAYLLGLDTISIFQILEQCPSLLELDLTVDSSPIITWQVSIIGVPVVKYIRREPRGVWNHILGFHSFVTKLILEGRTDVSDADLVDISGLCLSLSYLNIKGCCELTDEGISFFIQKSVKLHSLIASDTKFGIRSILSLCSRISDIQGFQATSFRKTEKMSGVDLELLHIGGCNGFDDASVLNFLSLAPTLKSLCLRQTSLNDRALLSFSGCSLEFLDVSNTVVTGVALSYIICRNPGLISLKARGCKNLYQESVKGSTDSPIPYSSQEMYDVLGMSCKLEELKVGWGFSYFSLNALGPAVMSLKAITIGLGGSVGPDGLMLLACLCPLLETISLLFQIISDEIMMNLIRTLRKLRKLKICYCIGYISSLSFNLSMPNLRILKLERVAPWMTNDDLALLSQKCQNLVEVSLIGCVQLDAGAPKIISCCWPGLISLHLEDCGEMTFGVDYLFDCKALEDLLLRHTGSLQQDFIVEAASKLPMLRKISVDCCDAIEAPFQQPHFGNRGSLRIVKIARCKIPKHGFTLRRAVHKETLVQIFDARGVHTTVVKERL